MSLRFPYTGVRVNHPLPSLAGRRVRPRPILGVTLIGPSGSTHRRCLLDNGADDTVFPEAVAGLLGIDLTTAPELQAGGVGGTTFPIRYAEITLRITDGVEYREWKAWVGFTSAMLSLPLLGFAG